MAYDPSRASPVVKEPKAQSDITLDALLDEFEVSDPAVRDRVLRLAGVESSGNLNATGPRVNGGMHNGTRARGALQIMPATAKAYPQYDLNDPADASRAGLHYFLDNLNQFGGDLDAATIAHHAGPGTAKKWLREGRAGTVDRATGLSTDDYLLKVAGGKRAKPADKWWEGDPVAPAEAAGNWWESDPVEPAEEPGLLERGWSALKDTFSAPSGEPVAVRPHPGEQAPAAAKPDSVMADYQGEQSARKTPANAQTRAFVQQQYDAHPEKREAMLSRPDWLGDIARQIDAEYQAMNPAESLKPFDQRREAKVARNRAQGMDPATAEMTTASQMIGGEAPVGSIKVSDFDFDLKQRYEGANPAIRGAVKGYEGYRQGILGFLQAGADLVGADFASGQFRQGAREAAGQAAAIGEGEAGARLFEGAVASLTQQLPLLIGGSIAGGQALILSGMAAQAFGQEYSEGRQAGLNGQDAATRASLFAAFEVIGEKFGLGNQLAALRMAYKGVPTKQLVAELGAALAKEIPGEVLTTTGQFLTDKAPQIGLNPEAGMAQYLAQVADTIGQTIIQGGLMMGGASAVSRGARAMQRPEPDLTADMQFDPGVNDALARQALNPANAQETADVASPLDATSYQGPGADPAGGAGNTPSGPVNLGRVDQPAGAPARSGEPGVSVGEAERQQVAGVVEQKIAEKEAEAAATGDPIELLVTRAEGAAMRRAVTPQPANGIDIDQDALLADVEAMFTDGGNLMVQGDNAREAVKRIDPKALASALPRGDGALLVPKRFAGPVMDALQGAKQRVSVAFGGDGMMQAPDVAQFRATVPTQEEVQDVPEAEQVVAQAEEARGQEGAASGKSAGVQTVSRQDFNVEGKDPHTISFEHKADGRLIQTVAYPDGEVFTYTLVTDRAGDETWVSQSQYEKGEFYPRQLSSDETQAAISIALVGESATPVEQPTQAPAARGQEGAQETRDSLIARFDAAEVFSDEQSELIDKLYERTLAEVPAMVERGEMPVFETGANTFMTISPSTQQPGKVQVTLYNKNGVSGDTQYDSVDDAIRGERLFSNRILSQEEANARFAESLKAEAEYQARAKERPATAQRFGQATPDQPQAQQADTRVTRDRPMNDGATITDAQGNQYRVHYQRNDLVIAHPIVDGKPRVSADTTVRFWTNQDVAPSGDNDRTDPIYPAPVDPESAAKSSLEREPASWVIRNKETGETVMETFDRAKVDKLNTAKYEAVPILQYLQEVNRQIKAEAAQPTQAPMAPEQSRPAQAKAADKPKRQPPARKPDPVTVDRAQRNAEDLRAMAQDAGWAEEGGRLIRDAEDNVSRTKWIPRAEWFMAGMEARPDVLAQHIEAAARGEWIPAKSARTIEGMVEWLDAQRGQATLDEDASMYDFEASFGDVLDVPDAREVAEFFDDAFGGFAEQSEADAMRALGFTEEEIANAGGQTQAGAGSAETADARGTAAAGERAGEAGAAQEEAGQGQQEELDPLDFTPKQYHEAKLKWVAQEYDLPMSEVREMQDSEADRKASEQEWVNAVKQAFRDGRELTAKTLDKLEEVRPGAFNSFLHDHPAANVPQGYQTPEARQIEKQRAQERKDDRKAAKEERAQPMLQSNGKPFPSEKLAAESARQRKLDMVPVEVDGGWGLAEKPVRMLNAEGRATDGKPIMPGDTFPTLSGRMTTPYPKQKGEKYASQWLIDNAKSEAESRGDDYNLRMFGATPLLKGGFLTEADKDMMLMYLFERQPDVVPGILKPLNASAEPLTLDTYTNADIAQREAEQTAQAEADARAERETAAKQRQAEERAEVRRRSEAAADTFELGMDPMENLTGQGDIFSQPAPQTAPQDDGDWLMTLFGEDAGNVKEQMAQIERDEEQKEAAIHERIKALRGAMDSVRKDLQAQYDDWAGRVYKKNKNMVELQGDGPSSQAAISVGSLNENRRRRAMEALNDSLQAVGRLEKQITADQGVKDMLRTLDRIMDRAKQLHESGNFTFLKSQDAAFEYILLDDALKMRPANGGSLTSNEISRAMLAFMKRDFADAGSGATESERFGAAAEPDRKAMPSGLSFPSERIVTNVQAAFEPLEVQASSIGTSGGYVNFGSQYPDGRYYIESAGKSIGFIDGKWGDVTTRGLQPKGEYDTRNLQSETIRVLQSQGAKLAKDAAAQQGGLNFSRASQTASAAFKRWFGDSKVVDAETGEPMVVYHGTNADFTEFDGDKAGSSWDMGKLGKGFYFSTDPRLASSYATNARAKTRNDAPQVMPAYVALQNPIEIGPLDWRKGENVWGALRDLSAQFGVKQDPVSDPESNQPNPEWSAPFRDAALAAGFDGVVLRFSDGSSEVVAFRPEQIKSAVGNNGNFDGQNPDIRRSFAGQNAETADTMALDAAQRRIAAGEDAEAVRQETGWFRGKDAPANAPKRFTRSALVQSISSRLPSLTRAVESALRRGDEGKPGGVVVVERAEDLAGTFASKTGRTLEEAQKSLQASIHAWHGSPYRFDRFDLGNVGMGEGAQAYGWGLYFADSRGVAEHYKSKLAKAELFINGERSVLDYNDPAGNMARQEVLDAANAGIKDAVGYARLQNYVYPGVLERLQYWHENGIAEVRKGALYKVSIAPDEDTFLLWDKPLSEQPKKVRDALRKLDWMDESVFEQYTGQQMYEGQVRDATMFEGRDKGNAQQEVSSALLKAGVRGIKYLDGQSRDGKGDGFNYVVFDDADVEIVDVMFSQNGDIQGFFDPRSGLTFLVAPNLTERTAPAVLLHEATHGKQRAEIDRKALDLIETRQARSKPLRDFLFRVERRMEAAGESGNASEAAAYIVEEAVVAGRQAGFSAVDGKLMNWIDLKFGRRVSDIVRDFVAMVRAWAMRADVELNPTVDDLVAIAKLNVRDMARGDVTGGEGVRDTATTFSGQPETVVIASRPEQIKSAVGNNGNFDPADRRINFSRSGQAAMSAPATAAQPAQAAPRATQAQTTPPDETRFQAFQRKAQDKLNRFTVIKEWLAAQGVTLSEQADVYKAEERMHSRFANKAEDFREKTVKPLVEKIQRAGYSMDDVAQYLHAQHAEERNIQVASINKQMPDGGSGMKTADANAILAAAPAELRRLANEFRAITERTKQILLDNGIISQDMADAWDATYQHYVPLKGGPEQGGKGAGKGLKANYKGKRALGHTLREEGEWIVENILADHERAIMLAEKNRVGQSLLKMAIEVGRDDLLTVGKPEKRGVLKNNTAYEVLFKGKVIGAFQSLEAARTFRATAPAAMKGASPSEFGIRKVSDPTVAYMASPMLADNEVNVYVKGQAIRVQINDDLLARAYGNMGTEALGAILRVGATINGYFSKIYTGYNPEFILTNIVRDFTTGVANVTGEEGAMMALRAAKDYPASFADLFRYATTGNASQWIRMYREDGGNTGAAYLSDLERLGDEISTEYAAYKGVLANLKAGDVKSAARAAGRKAFDKTLVWVERINQAGENAMRLAIYKAMIESGKSRAEAASLAKNATVNFNRNGEVGRQMNALWLFYNAGVQGTAAIAHANLKGRHKWQARAVSAGILGLGYTMAVALGAGDDEDDYDKLSDYTKARNVVIKTGDGWLKIPVPYGYGFFWNVGRAIADAERKGEWGKAPWHVASSFIEEFTPFGAAFAGDDLTLEQVTLGALPTLAQIPASVGMNRTTMGGPMYPESAFDKYQPDNEKMWRATKGTIPDMIAQALDQGGIEVSPETIKYLTRTFTGGAGQFVTSIGDAAWLTANGASLEAKEQPFVRKFYTETDVREARSAYHAAVAEAEKAVREGKSILKMGDHAAYGAYRVENQEFYALDRMAKAQAAAIKARRNYADAIRADKSLSVKEKRDRLKAAEAQEQVIYDRYLEVFKSRARH